MKNYCVDCKKELKTKTSKRCYSCENKRKHKLKIINVIAKKYFCIDCGKEITYGHKRCRSCEGKRKINLNIIGMKNRHHTKETKEKLKTSAKMLWQNADFRKKSIHTCSDETKEKIRKANKGKSHPEIRHHVYLKENSNTIICLSNRKHTQLHNRVYDYIMDKYGKKGIDDYIKWFDRKYGLK